MKKKFILKIANLISYFWLLIPSKLRQFIFTSLFIVESRGYKTNDGLKRVFLIKDKLEWVINERAIKYGSGIHPKHHLTKYHEFFIDRIKNGEKVLDVGCGNGSVAIDIALKHKKSLIVGVDINEVNIHIANKAKDSKSLKNIEFICSDINNQNEIKADIVILSNILEHILERKSFLKNLIKNTGSKKYLIRVPLFERDWQIALRKELGMYYYSDFDHKVEHTLEEFKNEVNCSNLKIIDIYTSWGEIWASCENAK